MQNNLLKEKNNGNLTMKKKRKKLLDEDHALFLNAIATSDHSFKIMKDLFSCYVIATTDETGKPYLKEIFR